MRTMASAAMIVVLAFMATSLSAQSAGTQPGAQIHIKWFEGANNPGDGPVAPGTQRHPALQFSFKRLGSATTPIELSRFGVNALGTLGVGYIDLFELWRDVNGDGLHDAGDVLIGQSYDGDFGWPNLPPVQPGQTRHLLVTVNINASAPVGEKLRLLTVQVPKPAYPYYFGFTPNEPTFGAVVTIGAVSFGGVVGGFQTVEVPPAPGLEVSDSAGSISSGAPASGERDFGSVDLADMPTSYAQITINNPGTADLQVGSPIVTGADAGDFILDLNGFGGTVTPGSTTTFGIAFDATTVGTKSATIEFTTNLGPTFSFEVAGTATSASVPQPGDSATPGGSAGGGCTAGAGALFPALLPLLLLFRRKRKD